MIIQHWNGRDWEDIESTPKEVVKIKDSLQEFGIYAIIVGNPVSMPKQKSYLEENVIKALLGEE